MLCLKYIMLAKVIYYAVCLKYIMLAKVIYYVAS